MKARELREKKDKELYLELEKLEKEYRDLKYKKVLGVIENPLRLRILKKDIARIKTILHLNNIEKLKKEYEDME